MILLQEGETFAGSDGDLAFARLELPGEDLKERGFAGAVGSDQAVTVPFGKFDIDVFKQGFFPHA